MKEPTYVITRKLGHRVYRDPRPKAEYYYCVRFGSRKVCEVWGDGHIRKFYDKSGKLTNDPAIGKNFGGISGRVMVAAMLLRDAFDTNTAMNWCQDISDQLRMPSDLKSRMLDYSFVTYTKAELFALVLAARQRMVTK